MSQSLKINRISEVVFENDLVYLVVHFSDPKLNSMKLPSFMVPQIARRRFYSQVSLPIEKIERNKIKSLLKICSVIPESLMNILNSTSCPYLTKKGLELPEVDINSLKGQLASLPAVLPLTEEEKTDELLETIFIWEIKRRREKLAISLKEMEHKLNRASDNSKAIRIVNNVNLCPFPEDFEWLKNSSIPEDLDLIADGCSCTDCCCSGNCQHFLNDSRKIAYRIDGRLENPDYYLNSSDKPRIHQCNKNCKSCGLTCCNRVAENGSHADMILYQTINDTGWGVLAGSAIAKGTFLGRYVGKLKLLKELLRFNDSRYIFELIADSSLVKNEGYGIDAKHCGNITRFFNHSCDPNVAIAAVQIESSHPMLFELSFFTSRDVQKGEQLCISYGTTYKTGDVCKCGSIKCQNPFQKDKSNDPGMSDYCDITISSFVNDGLSTTIINSTVDSESQNFSLNENEEDFQSAVLQLENVSGTNAMPNDSSNERNIGDVANNTRNLKYIEVMHKTSDPAEVKNVLNTFKHVNQPCSVPLPAVSSSQADEVNSQSWQFPLNWDDQSMKKESLISSSGPCSSTKIREQSQNQDVSLPEKLSITDAEETESYFLYASSESENNSFVLLYESESD